MEMYTKTLVEHITEEFLDSLSLYIHTDALPLGEIKSFFQKYELYGMPLQHFVKSKFVFGNFGMLSFVDALKHLQDMICEYGLPYLYRTPKVSIAVFNNWDIKFENDYPINLSCFRRFAICIDVIYSEGKLRYLKYTSMHSNNASTKYFTYNYKDCDYVVSSTDSVPNCQLMVDFKFFKHDKKIRWCTEYLNKLWDDFGIEKEFINRRTGVDDNERILNIEYNESGFPSVSHKMNTFNDCFVITYKYDNFNNCNYIKKFESGFKYTREVELKYEYEYQNSKLKYIFCTTIKNNEIVSAHKPILVLYTGASKTDLEKF